MTSLKTVELKAFLPARDFALSQQFYKDLGFSLAHEATEELAYFHHDNVSFLLENTYVKELAENLVMHLLVQDVDAWFAHIVAKRIPETYGIRIGPVALRPWNMRDFTIFDPSGVRWRIAQNTKSSAQA